MPWAVAAAGITAAAGLGSAAMQSGAAKSGQSAAIGAQERAQEQVRADLGPYNQTGQNALGVAGNLSGAYGPEAAQAAMGDFFTSPGYQWRLDQGLRAVDQGAAAKGMLRSGATLKGEMEYGQGLASGEFKDYYNRLYDLSKLGENAAAGQGQADLATGQGIAGTDRLAAAQQSSIYGNLGKGIGDTLGGLLSNKDVQSTLKSGWNSLMGPPDAGVVSPSGYTTAPGMASAGYTLGF